MKLRNDISIRDFLTQVHQCAGEVEFHTAEGDVLNLKSALSQYLFAAVTTRPALMETASVVCCEQEDYERLRAYFCEA